MSKKQNNYSNEFKEEAVKRVLNGVPASRVARELDINVNSLYTWKQRYLKNPDQPFVGSGKLHKEDEEKRQMRQRIKDLEQENEFLKKASGLLRQEPKVIRYLYIDANRDKYPIAKMVQWANVSKSGYYAWHRRQPSQRETNNEDLLRRIRELHKATRESYGSRRMAAQISRDTGKPVNHKRVARIMRANDMHTKYRRKYKATTYSDHKLPVAENLLNRQFEAEHPCEKMVSDITYIPTDEGWLYLAGILDLCGRKVVGVSMGARMTKQLIIDSLQDAINHSGSVEGCILHSDRGSQYCSIQYQEMAKAHGFVSSMSRKGNCWDNAPMESFWGSIKQEWLDGQHFKTRDEAKAAIFEYIWIFYNRQRIHSANGYRTPETYYNEHQVA
ncbi:MAG: IS3 family transposase [Selenomonas sp.]|nr:IS3 family transposase [Selenomonas sp.]